jgi:hypothetical protein
VTLRQGELSVIPRGVEHKTSARAECHALLVERAGTMNTGDACSGETAPVDDWI